MVSDDEYAGIGSHEGLTHLDGYDKVIALE